MNKKIKYPNVVLVGRMNVGKSTLFNRLTETEKSIVYDRPGVTRDYLQEVVNWNNKTFELSSEHGEVCISEKSSNNRIDLEITISALGELIVGSRSIYDLIEFENVNINPASVKLIDQLFPKQVNFFRDFF